MADVVAVGVDMQAAGAARAQSKRQSVEVDLWAMEAKGAVDAEGAASSITSQQLRVCVTPPVRTASNSWPGDTQPRPPSPHFRGIPSHIYLPHCSAVTVKKGRQTDGQTGEQADRQKGRGKEGADVWARAQAQNHLDCVCSGHNGPKMLGKLMAKGGVARLESAPAGPRPRVRMAERRRRGSCGLLLRLVFLCLLPPGGPGRAQGTAHRRLPGTGSIPPSLASSLHSTLYFVLCPASSQCA